MKRKFLVSITLLTLAASAVPLTAGRAIAEDKLIVAPRLAK